MSKAIIHVHQQKLKKGEPAIIVRDYKGSKHYSEVKVNGPLRIIHNPTPDRCGARIWIECDSKDIEYAE
jgi:hypothetical protein